jgi:hypothetical protein
MSGTDFRTSCLQDLGKERKLFRTHREKIRCGNQDLIRQTVSVVDPFESFKLNVMNGSYPALAGVQLNPLNWYFRPGADIAAYSLMSPVE